ncbi:Protein of unknown function [Gryllus bimaculatus]|nr:Protein of unknown function [Gryllus bimaculatus]
MDGGTGGSAESSVEIGRRVDERPTGGLSVEVRSDGWVIGTGGNVMLSYDLTTVCFGRWRKLPKISVILRIRKTTAVMSFPLGLPAFSSSTRGQRRLGSNDKAQPEGQLQLRPRISLPFTNPRNLHRFLVSAVLGIVRSVALPLDFVPVHMCRIPITTCLAIEIIVPMFTRLAIHGRYFALLWALHLGPLSTRSSLRARRPPQSYFMTTTEPLIAVQHNATNLSRARRPAAIDSGRMQLLGSPLDEDVGFPRPESMWRDLGAVRGDEAASKAVFDTSLRRGVTPDNQDRVSQGHYSRSPLDEDVGFPRPESMWRDLGAVRGDEAASKAVFDTSLRRGVTPDNQDRVSQGHYSLRGNALTSLDTTEPSPPVRGN